jgi:hypothetical protein
MNGVEPSDDSDPFKRPIQWSFAMATNEPIGDGRRIGAVKKRTQRKGKLMGKTAWTKRNKNTGRFMDVKKGERKFKGVRREKGSAQAAQR